LRCEGGRGMEVERRDEAAPLSLGGPSTLSPGSWMPPRRRCRRRHGCSPDVACGRTRASGGAAAPAPNKSASRGRRRQLIKARLVPPCVERMPTPLCAFQPSAAAVSTQRHQHQQQARSLSNLHSSRFSEPEAPPCPRARRVQPTSAAAARLISAHAARCLSLDRGARESR
jgi:hypothetical protein